MFTGIIKAKGEVKKISKKNGLIHMSFAAPKNWKFKNGESISVSGICSTLIKSTKNIFDVDYMKETLDKTTVSAWRVGKIVNLEKSMKMGDSMDGHLVYGHVDTVGKVLEIKKSQNNLVIKISLPKTIAKHVVYKGSVAIDGTSLTVSKKGADYFEVSLIPYTATHTTLGNLRKNDNVNIETDIMMKRKN